MSIHYTQTKYFIRLFYRTYNEQKVGNFKCELSRSDESKYISKGTNISPKVGCCYYF